MASPESISARRAQPSCPRFPWCRASGGICRRKVISRLFRQRDGYPVMFSSTIGQKPGARFSAALRPPRSGELDLIMDDVGRRGDTQGTTAIGAQRYPGRDCRARDVLRRSTRAWLCPQERRIRSSGTFEASKNLRISDIFEEVVKGVLSQVCPSRATKNAARCGAASRVRLSFLGVVSRRHLVYGDFRVICKFQQMLCDLGVDQAYMHEQFRTLRCPHLHEQADLLLGKRRSIGAIDLQHLSWRHFRKRNVFLFHRYFPFSKWRSTLKQHLQIFNSFQFCKQSVHGISIRK